MTAAPGSRCRAVSANYFARSMNLQIQKKKRLYKVTEIVISRRRLSYFALLYTRWHLHWSFSDLLEVSWTLLPTKMNLHMRAMWIAASPPSIKCFYELSLEKSLRVQSNPCFALLAFPAAVFQKTPILKKQSPWAGRHKQKKQVQNTLVKLKCVVQTTLKISKVQPINRKNRQKTEVFTTYTPKYISLGLCED